MNIAVRHWKPIRGYTGRYEVSSTGNIRNAKTGRILKQQKSKKGYLRITLSKHGKTKTLTVHRLVAKAFIPSPKRRPQVNHKDGNKLNNNFDNLEWVTNLQNQVHSWDNGRKPVSGSEHYLAVLSKKAVKQIRKDRAIRIPLRILAKQYGVSMSTISGVANYKGRWKHEI